VPEHDFIAIAQYSITPQQARALQDGPVGPPTYGPMAGNPRVLPDGRCNLRIEDIKNGVFAGCVTCEQVYEPGMEDGECPGEPDFYTPEGEPIWK
jgi:hypothetical protein